MKKTNVNVCDVCKDKLAIAECKVCKRDVCKNCFRYLFIDENDYAEFYLKVKKGKMTEERIPFCKECLDKFKDLFSIHSEEFEKDDDWGIIEKKVEERRIRFYEHLTLAIRDFMISEKI